MADVTITLPDELHERLRQSAAETGMTEAKLVLEFVKGWLPRVQWDNSRRCSVYECAAEPMEVDCVCDRCIRSHISFRACSEHIDHVRMVHRLLMGCEPRFRGELRREPPLPHPSNERCWNCGHRIVPDDPADRKGGVGPDEPHLASVWHSTGGPGSSVIDATDDEHYEIYICDHCLRINQRRVTTVIPGALRKDNKRLPGIVDVRGDTGEEHEHTHVSRVGRELPEPGQEGGSQR